MSLPTHTQTHTCHKCMLHFISGKFKMIKIYYLEITNEDRIKWNKKKENNVIKELCL